MVWDAYFGVIKPEKLVSWNENKDPFEILEENIHLNIGASWWDFFDVAKDILREDVQVDWGSWAYKANRKELRTFEKRLKCDIPGIDSLRYDVDYGIVFVEGIEEFID